MKRWIGCPIEDQYFGEEDRKAGKAERKIISAKDRSKYKKTDRTKYEKTQQEQKESKFEREGLLSGRVISILSKGVIVAYEGKNYTCNLRGVLKKEKGLAKNLVTVGDLVLFELTAPDEGVIAHVEPRKSVLSRADNLSRRKEQLIAANVDQVLITTCVVDPPLKLPLLERYIIAAMKGGMHPVIVVNKIDLLEQESELAEVERELFQEILKAYPPLGIPVIAISAATGQGIEELRQVMKEKVSVFSGQSGVGKTSLINLMTGLTMRVGETVGKTKKGAHTTSSAQLVPLEFGGWCIDTPGIKSFGVWDLKREDIESYFTEIYAKKSDCKFPNCSHTHEEDCAVIRAVEEGEISAMRYESYCILIDSVLQVHKRR
jgi:ribosome biogenesis GTPase / thiamine phosphate phosphatase